MRKSLRPLTVLTCTIALLTPAVAAQAGPALPAATGNPAIDDTTIDWQPCDEDPTAHCGTLRVPIDRSRPAGQTIELALAMRPATDPYARIGSLVVNPGGPGGAGASFVLGLPDYFSPELRSHFDIVGFDPRGVGQSHPVVCSSELLAQQPGPLLADQAEFEAMVAYNQELGEDCRARTGPLFDHLDTLNVVDDLDSIRAALGEEQLSYYGISYGTLIGQQYAERYPHRVRALALDSNMDHSLGTRRFLTTQTHGAQDSFDEFVAWCDRDSSCPLHGEDLRGFWHDLLARADRGELVVEPGPVAVTAYELINAVFSGLYGPHWQQLAELLVSLDEESAGTETPAPAAAAGNQLPTGVAAGEEVSAAPFQAIFCQDWELPVRDHREFEQYLRQLDRLAPDMRYSPLAVYATVSCLGWPSEVTNPQQRLRVPMGPQLLLTGAVHDPSTPYSWSLGAMSQLHRHASLLTYEGWGHGVYGRSECTTGAIDTFLVSLHRPGKGASCPGVEPAPAATTHRTPPPGAVTVPLPEQPLWHHRN